MFPPSIGGIQNQTLSIGRALATRGVEVHVITRPMAGVASQERLDGVFVHRVGVQAGWGKLRTAAYLGAGMKRLRELSARIDLIHAHQLLSPTTLALLSRLFAPLPLVLNPHACGSIGDVAILRSSAVGRVRLAATVRFAKAFVAINRAIHRELREVGVAEEAIWDIPNGVDPRRFFPAGDPERSALRRQLRLPEGPLVIFSGRLAREKGVDLLLEAWPRVVSRVPRARLWMLGTGAEAEALATQARRLSIEGSLAFAGAVAEVALYLRAADVTVLPSRTEGLSLAMLEAMASGLPVVATAVGGSTQVLEDGVSGRLVPPENPGALADALIESIESPAARRWGEAGRAQVIERFSIEAVAHALVGRYEQLLAEADR